MRVSRVICLEQKLVGKSGPRDRLDQDSRDYPALYPFGTNLVTFLTADQERSATFEQRLASCWRYMIGRARRFASTMKVRETAVLDVEDIVQSVVERLIEKDHLWDPDRGRYSTFVDSVIVTVLTTCHEKARAVSGPSNSYSRLADYREKEQSGSLTPGMRETMTKIEKVMGDLDTLSIDSPEDHDPSEFIESLRMALRRFRDPFEVWILVRRAGLFGVGKASYAEISERLGISEREARCLARDARAEVGEWILKGEIE